MSDVKITFEQKSAFQKEDCINRSAEYDCGNESTMEAVGPEGPRQARVRCCEDERCQARAAELVRVQYQ